MAVISKHLSVVGDTVECPVEGMGRINHLSMTVGKSAIGTFVLEICNQQDQAVTPPVDEWVTITGITYQDGTSVGNIVAGGGAAQFAHVDCRGVRKARIRKSAGAADAAGVGLVTLVTEVSGWS